MFGQHNRLSRRDICKLEQSISCPLPIQKTPDLPFVRSLAAKQSGKRHMLDLEINNEELQGQLSIFFVSHEKDAKVKTETNQHLI